MAGILTFAAASVGWFLGLARTILSGLFCDVMTTSLFFVRQNNFSTLSFMSSSGVCGLAVRL
jgi:hypothetical protein